MPRIWKRLILPAIGVATLAAALAPSTMALAEGPPAVTDLPPVTDTADLPGLDAEVDAARPSNGRTYLKGSGTLEARGVGDVVLGGHLKTAGVAYGGTLTVWDFGGDAQIRVENDRARDLAPDRRPGTKVVITNLHGEFEISGSRVLIRFDDTRIHLHARGTGFAVLSGHGWFKVNDGRMFRWGA
jgi:hypothetical protein